jgi:hypothetical protein
MTFCFKFSLDDVCYRALRRATLDVIFIIIQVPRGTLHRATSRFILNLIQVLCRAFRRATILLNLLWSVYNELNTEYDSILCIAQLPN